MGEEEDRKMQGRILVHDGITTRHMPPRLVPYWGAHERRCAISHAWVDEKVRGDVMTPINGEESPVPLQQDANLDLIRIEMLNHAWLRVL
ncbi:hypothetical protein IW261DRAFT_1479459, partial [Armillaria novae-zelandiae]